MSRKYAKHEANEAFYYKLGVVVCRVNVLSTAHLIAAFRLELLAVYVLSIRFASISPIGLGFVDIIDYFNGQDSFTFSLSLLPLHLPLSFLWDE